MFCAASFCEVRSSLSRLIEINQKMVNVFLIESPLVINEWTSHWRVTSSQMYASRNWTFSTMPKQHACPFVRFVLQMWQSQFCNFAYWSSQCRNILLKVARLWGIWESYIRVLFCCQGSASKWGWEIVFSAWRHHVYGKPGQIHMYVLIFTTII